MIDLPNNSKHKICVGIFFGGKSAEHEVSLQSAINVLDALDKTQFEPVLIGIDKMGRWHPGNVRTQFGVRSLDINSDDSMLTLIPGGAGKIVDAASNKTTYTIDVAFPVLHGPLGEDGTIQGLFELADIPYVGPSVLGSALGMDKDAAKRLLRDAGVPIAPFQTLSISRRPEIIPTDVMDRLGPSVFVKPANMGSSVGVRRAQSAAELTEAIDFAFQYDTKILIESEIHGEEIECAVLGNEDPTTSVIGKIIPRSGDFYSYDAKYIDEDGAILEIPATLPDGISQKAQAIALKTFTALCCTSMARVDMFVTKDQHIIVNEINTIPGFTKISMYPKLWEISGLPYQDLITKLLTLAIERHKQHATLKTSM